MAKDPAFLFYPGDWLSGTMYLTHEQKGAYMDLLILQFNVGKFTEAQAKQVLSICFDVAWPMLEQKFKKDGNFYFNVRLQIEIEKRKNFSESRRNNAKGNKSPKNDKLNTEASAKHMHEHMEDVNVNRNDSENFERGAGENFIDPRKKETANALMLHFGFNEIANMDKLRWIWQFVNHVEETKGLDYFISQFQAYNRWKELSGEIKHNFTGLLGSPAKQFENGGWDADNWQFKIDNFKPPAKSDKMTSTVNAFAEAKDKNPFRK